MNRIRLFLSAAILGCTLVATVGPAVAQSIVFEVADDAGVTEVPTVGDAIDAASSAWQTGAWWSFLGACALLIAAVAFQREMLGKFVPWLLTDRGGVTLVFASSFLGVMGHALISINAFGFGLVVEAAAIALGAIGGYTGFKRMVWPAKPKP